MIAFLVPAGLTASGLLLLAGARIRPAISPAADLTVSFLIGAGAITLLVLWVSTASSVALTVGLVVAVASVPAAALVLLMRLHHLPAPRVWIRKRPVWLIAVPLTALAAYQGWLVTVGALHSGPGWDGVFVWDIKARYFLISGGVPQSFFSDASRQWSHPTYPLLLSLVEALVFRTLGGAHQWADLTVTAMFVVGLVILFHEMVRRARGLLLAGLLTLVLITAPAFWMNALVANADLPMALFVLAGAWFVYRWFDHGRRIQDMILGGVLLAGAMWVKHEGLVVWSTGAAVMAAWTVYTSIHRRTLRWGPLCAYTVPAITLVPWWLSVAHGGVSDRDFVPVSVTWLVEHSNRIPVLIGMLIAELTNFRRWGIAWILVGAGVVLKPPLRSPGRCFLLAVVLVHTVILTLVYTFSTWVPYTLQVDVSASRVIFQVFPVSLLLLATGLDRDWWRVVPLRRRRHAWEESGMTERAPADTVQEEPAPAFAAFARPSEEQPSSHV